MTSPSIPNPFCVPIVFPGLFFAPASFAAQSVTQPER